MLFYIATLFTLNGNYCKKWEYYWKRIAWLQNIAFWFKRDLKYLKYTEKEIYLVYLREKNISIKES